MNRHLRAGHLAYVIRPTPLHRFLGPALERLSERDWVRTGEGPAPASVKHRLILDYATSLGIKTFIETGTFFGDMIDAVRHAFEEVHSIELDHRLHARACKRFTGVRNVHLHQGDSGRVLPELVAKLDRPALFWLDAHWSRGVTARGDLDTPVSMELASILEHGDADHVALIDDARLFGVAKDYPTVEEVRSAVTATRPNWDVQVFSDVIHVGQKKSLLGDGAS